jgi:hypothetical protein
MSGNLRVMTLSPQKSALALAAALALVVGASFMFRVFDWGQGPVRGIVLFEMLTAMALLGAPTQAAQPERRLRFLANAVIAGGAALWLATAAGVILQSARAHHIPLDQGQTTFRAARLLLKGENPYGFGQLVDFQAVKDRMGQREAAGLAPTVPPAELETALTAYDRALDAATRAPILPPEHSAGAAALEKHLLGYKYGPLFPLMALPLGALDFPAGIMALNALAAAALVAALYALMRERANPMLARFGLAALLCDTTLLVNFIEKSATDVWALLAIALAALAATRGRFHLAAVALALGFGLKIFPTALACPLLLAGGRWRPALTFAAVAAAIYAPFAAWDFSGLMHNVFLWPAYLGADSTSWLASAPPLAAKAARALGLVAIAFVWARWLTGREPSLFRTLALVALLALVTSATLHNNYIPWASVWIVAALVERFGPPSAARAPARQATWLAWRGGAL